MYRLLFPLANSHQEAFILGSNEVHASGVELDRARASVILQYFSLTKLRPGLRAFSADLCKLFLSLVSLARADSIRSSRPTGWARNSGKVTNTNQPPIRHSATTIFIEFPPTANLEANHPAGCFDFEHPFPLFPHSQQRIPSLCLC